MEIESVLEEILAAAKRDSSVLRAFLRTEEDPSPVRSFCALAAELGYPVSEMDLIYAGEEAYAAMRRSTNGGGENSPALRNEEDYHELFMTKLKMLAEGRTDGRAGSGGTAWLEDLMEDPFEEPLKKRNPADGAKLFSGYVGVFDSGVGGLSVLSEMTRLMPSERFLYFGDSANAPYGERTEEWVRNRSEEIADRMIENGAKAIVIACNTATAAAAAMIREKYPDVPVIGVEPALKVAVTRHQGDSFLVMATNVTLRLEKYHRLEQRLEKEAKFFPLACDGLAARIEKGNLDGEDLEAFLGELLTPYVGQVDGIVLGCTHYPLIREQIRRIFGDIPLYDGGEGTARELKRRLGAAGLTAGKQTGKVLLYSSKKDPGQKELYESFFRLAGEQIN